MRILFLFYEDPWNPVSFPLGIGLLSALAKRDNHAVTGIYVHEDPGDKGVVEDIASRVREFTPNLIAYSCSSPAFQGIKQIAEALRKQLRVPAICGGAHPTLYPEDTLTVDGIDYVCVGEGDISFVEFVRAFEKGEDCTRIPGIFAKNEKGEILRNRLNPLVQDLDRLPWTDYDVFGRQFILQETADGWLRHISSRGCPYSCTYCHTPMFRKVYAGGIGVPESRLGYVRLRGVGSLIDELLDILGRYDLKVINFMDDLFCLKKGRTLEFCRAFKDRMPPHVGFSIQTHLHHMDEEVVAALVDSRCLRVVVGVESGSQRILDLFNRKTTPAEMKEKLHLLVKAHFPLGTWSLNILGNPTETKEEMLETLRLSSNALVERIKINIMSPYPKSSIHDYCVEKNLFLGDGGTQEFQDRHVTKLKFPDPEMAFLEKFLDVGHWYVNVSAPLGLADRYIPLIEEVERIGPGGWAKARQQFLAKNAELSKELRDKNIPFYDFVLRGKVYSNVIGLMRWS